MFKKRLALVLSLAILISFIPTMNSSVNAFESIYEFEDLGDSWASEALAFALGNKILYGKEPNKVKPNDNLMRSEIAAIVTRLFYIKEGADISHLTDVPEYDQNGNKSWYYDPISKAVAMGAFSGQGSTFQPLQDMTREEIFVVLSRVFKVEELNPASEEDFANFVDLDEVSDYAKGPVMSLLSSGYVAGVSIGNGQYKVNPHATMTRAEFAQSIYNIVEGIISKPGVYYQSDLELNDIGRKIDNIIVNVPGVVLEDIVIEGNLYISDGLEYEEIILNNVEVKGNIILRSGDLILKPGTRAKNIYVSSKYHVSEIEVKDAVKVDHIISDSQLNLFGDGFVDKVRLKSGADSSVIAADDIYIELDKTLYNVRDKYGRVISFQSGYINKSIAEEVEEGK